MIVNPILPGFNPDPSICRMGDDYYIATSTFEWYPGVQIHHSKDLVNWTLVARPLNRAALLDMRGNPDSCGIWAPCLSHDGEKFWLVYTDVKRYDGAFKDAQGRKFDVFGGRRRCPQDPPEHGQRNQCRQRPGGTEKERPECGHARAPKLSIWAFSAAALFRSGVPVTCETKRQPMRWVRSRRAC